MGVLASVARLRVTVAYAIVVTCVTMTLLALGPQAQERAISRASTNLHNLSRGHIGTLLDSAFVVDAGPIYEWLPGLVCVLAVAELLWGSWRLIVAFAVGHVGATLLVAVGLTAAVEWNWLDAGSVTRATDVGMSYGAAGVLGALTAAVPRRWRSTWIGWWLGGRGGGGSRQPRLHRRGPRRCAGARNAGVDAIRRAGALDAGARCVVGRRGGVWIPVVREHPAGVGHRDGVGRACRGERGDMARGKCVRSANGASPMIARWPSSP